MKLDSAERVLAFSGIVALAIFIVSGSVDAIANREPEAAKQINQSVLEIQTIICELKVKEGRELGEDCKALGF